MDDSLAGGAPGGSIAGGEFNVTALLALDAAAGSGGAGLLLGGAEKLACRSKENSPTVGATIGGAGAIGSSPLFAPAPNRSSRGRPCCGGCAMSCCAARCGFANLGAERDSHLAPLEAVLAGRPRLTHCGVWLCALVLYDVASFLRCSQTWQRRFRPVYGFCPLALAPLNRAPRALAHPSTRRSAILECLSAPRALAGARKVPRMARRGHARIISVETHRLPFLGYLWRWFWC